MTSITFSCIIVLSTERKGKIKMSTFFQAYVIFGVKVKHKILTKYDNKRGCSHEETDKNFCAICGAPMWKTLRYKVELNDFANNVDDVSYYYSSDPSENDDIVIGFLVNTSDCIDELTELTNAQKQHYTGKLNHWFKTHVIKCEIEPKSYLILYAG